MKAVLVPEEDVKTLFRDFVPTTHKQILDRIREIARSAIGSEEMAARALEDIKQFIATMDVARRMHEALQEPDDRSPGADQ